VAYIIILGLCRYFQQNSVESIHEYCQTVTFKLRGHPCKTYTIGSNPYFRLDISTCLDQELISYRYSSCSSLGWPLQKKPKAPSFHFLLLFSSGGSMLGPEGHRPPNLAQPPPQFFYWFSASEVTIKRRYTNLLLLLFRLPPKWWGARPPNIFS